MPTKTWTPPESLDLGDYDGLSRRDGCRDGCHDHQDTKQRRPPALDSAPHYAQEHNLTVDLSYETSKRTATFYKLLRHDVKGTDETGLTGFDHLPECIIHVPIVDDDWVDAEDTLDLDQLLLDTAEAASQDLLVEYPRHPMAKQLRLELPLLRSDNELDLLSELKGVCERDITKPLEIDLPLAPVDDDSDEGLIFPSWAEQVRNGFDSRLQGENIPQDPKLQVSGLYGIGDDTSSSQEDDCGPAQLIDQEFAAWQGSRCQMTPFTPPLLPLPSTHDVFVPDGDACNIGSPSGTCSLLEEDLNRIEADLVTKYEYPTLLETDICLPASSPPLPTLTPQEAKLSSLKVEVPLLHNDRQSSDLSEKAALVVAVSSILPLTREQNHDRYEPSSSDEEASSPFNDSVMAHIQEYANRVSQRVEQERLSGIESARRVHVPTMDFTIPAPYWQPEIYNPKTHFKNLLESSGPLLTGVVKSGHRREKIVTWNPFKGRPAKLDITGQLGDGNLQSYLGSGKEGIGIRTGLRLLEKCQRKSFLMQLDDDEELYLEPKVRGRPPAGFGGAPLHLSPKRPLITTPEDPPVRKRPKHVSEKAKSEGAPMPDLLCAVGEYGAEGLLSRYLKLQAPGKPLSTRSSHFANKKDERSVSATAPVAQNLSPRRQDIELESRAPVPTPECQTEDTAKRYIIATTLGSAVMRKLEEMCPRIDFFDRDFNQDDLVDRSAPSTQPLSRTNPLACEADVSLSTLTGVMVTNVMEVRQKSPKGTDQQTKLRRKVQAVAELYNKVIILISDSGAALGSDDTRAYANFISFTMRLATPVDVFHVGEGEEVMAKWIVSLMNKYRHEAVQEQELIILEETTWEVFFRSCGLNVYSAQVLSGTLKATYGREGLARFIAMTPSQRDAALGRVLGAPKSLERINRFIDGKLR